MTRTWVHSSRNGLAALVAFAVLAAAPAAEAASPRKLTADRATSSLTLRTDYHAGEVVVPVNKSQIIEVDQNVAEVSIGNPEIADVVPLTQRRIYVFGKQLGVTSLTLTGRGGKVIAVVDLAVSYDINGLKTQLFDLVPDQMIEVRPANDGLVLSGQVGSAAQLARVLAVAERYAPERVTNLLEVTGNQQVMLAVRFAEIQRNVVKQLGFSNLLTVNGSDASGFLFNGDGPSLDPRTFGLANITASLGDLTLDFLLDALEEKGVVKTLAEPNLIALSGDSARFLAGGEFPIPVGRDEEDSGKVDVTIAFKEFGVSLSFTPTVISDDLINLELFTEVSEIDPRTSILFDDLVIPGLKVRRAKTTVELGDSQSFAIAGLLQEGFEDAVRQFPVLGDVPMLGTLFRSTQFQTGQTELVMIVTPHLVQPSTKEALITPSDLFVPPSDAELFLLGRVQGDKPLDPDSPANRLSRRGAVGIVGPYGYILK